MNHSHRVFQPLVFEVFLETHSKLFTDQMGKMGDGDPLLLRNIRQPDWILIVLLNIFADMRLSAPGLDAVEQSIVMNSGKAVRLCEPRDFRQSSGAVSSFIHS